jgi:putative transposase
MAISPKLVDELLKDYRSPSDLLGEDWLLQQLTKALVERALQGELSHHLGYDKRSPKGKNSGNSRNGPSAKTLGGKRGQVHVEVPRDRSSDFEPQLVKKNQTRFDGLDDKIISLYARGMTTREIQGHLEEIYGVEVSPSLISSVTDAVIDEVRAWQTRPLDSIYPIVYLDAIQVKVKSQGRVVNRAIYPAFGVNLQGLKEVLGMWAAEAEGAKFWLSVVTERKNRGVQDIYIACVDGLKGFPEAIESVSPNTQVQLCLVHMVRHPLSYVSHRDRKQVATDMKGIYQAATLSEAEHQLAKSDSVWAGQYPLIVKSWRANWGRVTPMFGYPQEVRRAIYTTNTIESLNMTLRKIIKNRSLFPGEEAVFKLLYLALRNISRRWRMPIRDWGGAMNQSAIIFEGRVPMGGM